MTNIERHLAEKLAESLAQAQLPLHGHVVVAVAIVAVNSSDC